MRTDNGNRETFRQKTAKKRFLVRPTQSLREAYGYSMILHPVRHLELSTDKGTKNACETADILRGSDTSDRKIFGEMTEM